MMAHKLQAVVDADVLNDRGSQRAFAKRQRQLTPCRFGLSVIASMATKQSPSIAALHRDFNALWDVESTYKAFYNQGAQTSCAEFFRTSLGDLMGKRTMKVLGFEAGQALSECKRCVMQDGRAVPSTMRSRSPLPGRFHAVKPLRSTPLPHGCA
jgi:hypothetical protein